MIEIRARLEVVFQIPDDHNMGDAYETLHALRDEGVLMEFAGEVVIKEANEE